MRENDKLTLVQVLDVVIKRCEASAEEFLETAPEFSLGFGFLVFFSFFFYPAEICDTNHFFCMHFQTYCNSNRQRESQC